MNKQKKAPVMVEPAITRTFFKYKTLIRKNGHTLKVNVLNYTH